MKTSRFLSVSVLIVIIQLLISNLVDISLFVCIMLLPYILIASPKTNTMLHNALVGFIVGIAYDLLSNGIIGLCAASMTVVGILRNFFLGKSGSNGDEEDACPCIWNLGASRFFYYALACNFAFFLIFIPLEYLGQESSPLLIILRGVSGILLNTGLVMLISAFTTDKQR